MFHMWNTFFKWAYIFFFKWCFGFQNSEDGIYLFMYHVYSKNKIVTNYKLLPFKTMHFLNIHIKRLFQKSTSISPIIDSYFSACVYTLLLNEFQQTVNIILNVILNSDKVPQIFNSHTGLNRISYDGI